LGSKGFAVRSAWSFPQNARRFSLLVALTSGPTTAL
jgi:hypothetical protein